MISKSIFLDKPECIINLPASLLSQDLIKKYRGIKDLAIVEIAGRDSVAAAIKAAEDEGFTDLLPVYTYTGTEYGKWKSVEDAVKRLSRKKNLNVHNLLATGSPGFWRALNGRFISSLVKRYGILIPCVGCHLYLHSARIPLSVLLGVKPVISGERESHDGRKKINQTPESLDAYIKTAGRFGVPLLMPLRHIGDGKEIENILGFEWKEGMEQLECTLSGNYRNIDGGCDIKKEQMKNYINEFLLPCAEKIITAYLEGVVPDHVKIARDILGTQK